MRSLSIRPLVWWGISLTVLIGLLYAVLTGANDPLTTLSIFSTRFLGIFIEAAPFLLMGTVVSGLIEVFVTQEDIVRVMPRNPVLATISGAFLGFAFPVCECGVVPVTRRLFLKGLPMSVGVAFLLAAPVMNPIVLVSTYIAFGSGPMLLARLGVTAVVAIGVGLVFALAARPQDVMLPQLMAPVRGGSGDPEAGLNDLRAQPGLIQFQKRTTRAKVYDALRIASDETFDMGRFLITGSLLAALMQTVVSQETLLAIGEGPLLSVLLMQALAFVLSVCSTVDAFLALAFAGTFSSGSILAFLTFGPMVDIKSLMMFSGVFRPRTIVYLLLLPLLMTLLVGVWVNLFGWL